MSERKDLLFELGTEEIPARFLPPAVKQMRQLAIEGLKELALDYNDLKVFTTPRRLVLAVYGLAAKQEDLVTEQKGPAKKAAYDAEGKPTRALEGFCKGQGVTPAELTEKEINGNSYLYAQKSKKGQSAQEVLPAFCADLINKIYFPKPMRWGYQEMRFARPVRWLILLFGDEVLDLTLADVKAGRLSRGHRVLGSQAVEIQNLASYEDALYKNYVIVDQAKRKEVIREQVSAVAKAEGGLPINDEELLDEVTYILEWPTALAGSFEEKYLQIPAELIITPMREYQRYFPVHAADGKLLPRFITVRNGDNKGLELVREGNEKVLRARLADAEFFWNEDLKLDLVETAKKLSTVVYQEQLGDMAHRLARMQKLAALVGDKLAYTDIEQAQTARAAAICKSDLLSRAVFEFTELQGVMGEYYAQAAGEEPQVAAAVREHYLPRFAGDELPATKAGIALAIAERLDSLAGFFAIGLKPTGSQDPYALRRAASGIVQIIVERKLQLSVSELVAAAYRQFAAEVELSCGEQQTVEAVCEFIGQRLVVLLTDKDYKQDTVAACFAAGADNLLEAARRVAALDEYRRGEGFAELTAGFTRAANILKKAQAPKAAVDPALFADEAEGQLYEAAESALINVNRALQAGDYAAALAAVGCLRAAIDSFFEKVMVMDNDERVKNNRLALLGTVISLTADIADLSLLR